MGDPILLVEPLRCQDREWSPGSHETAGALGVRELERRTVHWYGRDPGREEVRETRPTQEWEVGEGG